MCGKTWYSMRNLDKKYLNQYQGEIVIRIGAEETICHYIFDSVWLNHLLTLAIKDYNHPMNNELLPNSSNTSLKIIITITMMDLEKIISKKILRII